MDKTLLPFRYRIDYIMITSCRRLHAAHMIMEVRFKRNWSSLRLKLWVFIFYHYYDSNPEACGYNDPMKTQGRCLESGGGRCWNCTPDLKTCVCRRRRNEARLNKKIRKTNSFHKQMVKRLEPSTRPSVRHCYVLVVAIAILCSREVTMQVPGLSMMSQLALECSTSVFS